MNDMMKLIVIGVGGAVVSFLLMLGIFWMVLKPGAKNQAMGEQPAEGQQAMANQQMAMPQGMESQFMLGPAD